MIDRPAAIVHDWFQGFHGSERVVETMRTGLFAKPPDVFTFHAAKELLPPDLAAAIKQESRLAGLPGLRQRGHDPGRWRLLAPLMPRYFSRLDLDAYDVVVSSSHAFAVHARPREDALHVCYCHTPIRYAWMPDTDARAKPLARWLRRKDLAASRRGPTSTWRTRPRSRSGSGASTAATRWSCIRRSTSTTSIRSPRRSPAASSGRTGSSPTRTRRRSSRRFADCRSR